MELKTRWQSGRWSARLYGTIQLGGASAVPTSRLLHFSAFQFPGASQWLATLRCSPVVIGRRPGLDPITLRTSGSVRRQTILLFPASRVSYPAGRLRRWQTDFKSPHFIQGPVRAET
jgi:hypothetical protein